MVNSAWPSVIAIGASTGGPKAVQIVLENMPLNMNSIVFVVQHMPENFTKSFADRLKNVTGHYVSESTHQEFAQPGHVYVAKGGIHLMVREVDGKIQLLHSMEPTMLHRPSIDVFLYSFAGIAGSKRAAILTGMGADGAKGLHEVRLKGGITVVENEVDCVVYGMPKAAYEMDRMHQVLPLIAIGDFLSGIQ
jgi:two-component system chemotaxis response regulator CheB